MKTKLSCVFIIFKILLISSIYSQSFSVITLNMPLNAELVEKIDVDSDGDQDLIVTYKDTSGVWWYKNIDGKGSFSIAQLLFSTSEKPVQLYVADFDKDEDQDIAYYINGNEIKIIWRENINENFSTIKEVGIFSSFAQKPIVMADFDQDGDFDFLAQAFSSNLKIELFQNNTGVFQKTSALLPNNIVELQNLSLIDINEDDQLDILLSGRFRFQDSSAVLWFRGIIDTFSFAPPQIIQTFSDVIRDVTIADLDEDGDQDILTYTINELQNKVHWFENLDRSEQFGQGRVIFEYSDFVYRDIERTIITIDTDNDDDLDILCTADISIGGHDTYAHFENTDGKGSFQKLEPTLVGADKANTIILSDIDGNSSSDIIFISDQRDALVNIKFNTDHTPVEKVVDQGCGLPNNLSVADFDNDGFQDVMVGAAASNNVLWYKNINGKQFSRQEVDNLYNEPRAAIATDIDVDQKTDILVSYYQSGILWYRNEAEGKFAAPIQIVNDNAGITWSIAAGDIDGDGDNDIVSLPQNISQSITTYLTVYENVNNGMSFNLKYAGTYDNGLTNRPLLVKFSDIDGDNDLDIITGGTEVAWFENLDGKGTYVFRRFLTNSIGADDIIMLDFDSDQDIDIIFVSKINDYIAWIPNLDGKANFGEAQIIIRPAAISPTAIKSIDMDKDNHLDLLAVGSGTALWIEKNGIDYNTSVINLALSDPIRLEVADLNKDGKDDFVVSFLYNEQVRAYINEATTALPSILDNAQFMVAPNPFNQFLTIRNKNHNLYSNWEISLIDALGRNTLLHQNIKDLNEFTINTNHLKNGIYFLKIKSSKGVDYHTVKLIKNK